MIRKTLRLGGERHTSTTLEGSVRSRATALADEDWLLLRTVAVLGILVVA